MLIMTASALLQWTLRAGQARDVHYSIHRLLGRQKWTTPYFNCFWYFYYGGIYSRCINICLYLTYLYEFWGTRIQTLVNLQEGQTFKYPLHLWSDSQGQWTSVEQRGLLTVQSQTWSRVFPMLGGACTMSTLRDFRIARKQRWICILFSFWKERVHWLFPDPQLCIRFVWGKWEKIKTKQSNKTKTKNTIKTVLFWLKTSVKDIYCHNFVTAHFNWTNMSSLVALGVV